MSHSENTLSYSQVLNSAPKSTKGLNATPSSALTSTYAEFSARFSSTLPPPTTGPSAPSPPWPVSAESTPTQDTVGVIAEGESPLAPQQTLRAKGTRGKGRPQWKFLNPPKPDVGEPNEGSSQLADAAASHTEVQPTPATPPESPCGPQTDTDTPPGEPSNPEGEPQFQSAHTEASQVLPNSAVSTTTALPPAPSPVLHGTANPSDVDAENPSSQLEGDAHPSSAIPTPKFQPHVWVLIDGDQCIFKPEFFLDSKNGGTNAAKAIHAFIKRQFPGRYDLLVSVELAWNQEGLRRALNHNGYPVTRNKMRQFVHNFQADPLWCVSDRGYDKEAADVRVQGLFHVNIKLPQTEHIFIAYSEDGGYRTNLRGVLDPEQEDKVSIITGYKNSNPLPPFACDVHEIPGLFMEERMPSDQRWSVTPKTVSTNPYHTPSPPPPYSKTRTPSAPGAITLPPSPADLSENWRSNSDDPQGESGEAIATWSSFSTDKSNTAFQFPRAFLAAPRPQYSHSPVLLRPAFQGKPLEEVEPTSTAGSPESEGDGGDSPPEPGVSTMVILQHTFICPSVDCSNHAFAPSSCRGGPLCHFRHECPYGAECVLRKKDFCNFP